jgi:plasmid maintenance system antidote protein VapI
VRLGIAKAVWVAPAGRITADVPLDLAEALGTSPKLWKNLQATWDLAQAECGRSVA